MMNLNNQLNFSLQHRKQELVAEIDAAYKQLGKLLDDVHKLRIQRQIKALEDELVDIENKINFSILSSNQLNKVVSTPIHNLPERNRFFTGRVDVLNQLSDLIKSHHQVALKQAISGMGGIGKTQTALEFCYRQIPTNSYQTILWVNAENEASFNNSYYSLVNLLNLISPNHNTATTPTNDALSSDGTSNQGLKVDEVISLIKRWLANNSNWFMVLDNLEDPKLIKDYLPSNHQGHVLITTRSQSLKGQAAIVQLKKMSPETGTLFLLKRASLIPIDANNLEQFKADNGFDNRLIVDAQKIVQAMDGLPLALEQAGAYIQESECSLADYLKAYEDVRNTANILDNDGEDANDHKSVYATFKLNFDVVKEKSVAGAKLLEVCSFLDSELIPEEIFTSAGNFLGDELAKLQDNTYEFNNCIKLLLNYSLIERNTSNKSLSIHRLVQIVIRELLAEDNKKLLLDSLAKALGSFSNNDVQDPKNWPFYQKLLPSITSFFSFVKFYQPSIVETAHLFHQFGVYCDKKALYTQSLDFYNLALDIYKLLFGDNHPDVASILNNIGLIHGSQAQFHDALYYLHNALVIRRRILTKHSPDIAGTLNNIGEIHRKLNEHDNALNYYQQAFNIFKNIYGESHFSVAMVLNNISIIQACKKNYSEALSNLEKVLVIRRAVFGNHHPDVAGTLNNIGNVYTLIEQYPEALQAYYQALSVKKQLFGDSHPDVASTLNNIAFVHQSQSKNDEAKLLQSGLNAVNKPLNQSNQQSNNTLTFNISTAYPLKPKK